MPVSAKRNKIDNAIKRLEQNLPLRYNQVRLPQDLRRLHQSILWFSLKNGRAPRADDFPELDQWADALARLVEQKIILLDASGVITGAYPFVDQPRGFSVTSKYGAVQAMCAFDALAVSGMFAIQTQIDSHCRRSHCKIIIKQNAASLQVVTPDTEVFAAIDWNARDSGSTCAESLCTEMMFIAGGDEAAFWQAENQSGRELFDLNTAQEMINRIFLPLMQ